MNKDSMAFGIVFSLVLPVICFLVLWGIFFFVVEFFNVYPFMQARSLVLLSIAINFIFARFWFNRQKKFETVKGIMFATLIMVLLFFLFIHGTNFVSLPGLAG